MAKWEYGVVYESSGSELSRQLNNMAKEGWEPILYSLATEPPSEGQESGDELHYVIIRRQPEQEAGVTFVGEREKE